MRIGVEFSFLDPTYTFGIIYYKGLLRALRRACGERVRLVLLSQVDAPYVTDEHGPLVDERVERPQIRRWTRDWVRHRLGERVLRRDGAWRRTLEAARLDVIMFGRATAGAGIPVLGWLPDFQHHHLPDMFDEAERARRDAAYRRTAEESTLLLLMSEAVRADFAAFAPDLAVRARVLHPMTVLPGAALEADPAAVAAGYHLPERFVYLPNQFWRHKNHAVVWEALSDPRCRDVRVVCSGHAADGRHPRYFGDVLTEIARRGLGDRVTLLGTLPHPEVLNLMRRSVAVLNPSLFEGFGMSVNEAKTLGRPLVLSDLPSHREQDPPGARFFAPGDAGGLAEHLAAAWAEGSPGPSHEAERAALAAADERLAAYGRAFHAILQETAAGGAA